MLQTVRPTTITVQVSALRVARERRGLTMAEVADKTGAEHASQVSRWERGTATPRPVQARLLYDLYEGAVGWPDIFGAPDTASAQKWLKAKSRNGNGRSRR